MIIFIILQLLPIILSMLSFCLEGSVKLVIVLNKFLLFIMMLNKTIDGLVIENSKMYLFTLMFFEIPYVNFLNNK